MTSAAWILLAGSVVAFLLLPMLILCYRKVSVPKRLEEIKQVFSNPDAFRQYYELFIGPRPKEGTVPAGVVEEQFLNFHRWRYYVPPFLLLLAVSGLVIGVAALWVYARLEKKDWTVQRVPTEVIFALGGTYVWSVFEVLHRTGSRDFLPENLYELVLRFIGGALIGYSASLLVFEKVQPVFAGLAAAFPLRDVRLLIRQYYLKRLGQETKEGKSRTNEGHLGSTLEGLSDQHLARLEELHLVTFLDMAYADPVRLMARTGFSLRAILCWIDQALLVVYGEDRKLFDQMGMPCALDACESFQRHCYFTKEGRFTGKPDKFIQAMGKHLKMDPLFVVELFHRIYWDPHVRFLSTLWYTDAADGPRGNGKPAPPPAPVPAAQEAKA